MTDALADAVPGPSPEDTVAAQVRRRREALGLSNGALAARAGISKAMLSKIEHRRTSCSLSTLARLAEALAVPVSALLHGTEPAGGPIHVPAADGPGGDRLLGPPGNLEAHLVTLTEDTVIPVGRHIGREVLYVLEGAMVFAWDDARYTLRTGDALAFDGDGEHGPYELLEAPVRFLSVVSREA
jgi:transcriptional regulator with XRE-family HTH domain